MFINEILGPEVSIVQAVQMATNRKQWSYNSKLRCENLLNQMGTISGRNCEVGDKTRRSKRSLSVERSMRTVDHTEEKKSENIPTEKRRKLLMFS